MRRPAILFFLAIIGWYALVIFFKHKVICSGPSARDEIATTLVYQHLRNVRAGEQDFGDLDMQQLGWTISRIDRVMNSGGLVQTSSGSTPYAILARPHLKPRFRVGLAERLLFLDFLKYEHQTYLLREDGMICVAQKDPLQSQQTLSAKDVASAESSGMWDDCHMVSARKSASDPDHKTRTPSVPVGTGE